MIVPRVSLLFPNHNSARVLQHVLDCLAANTTYPDVELVAVDDGSTDGSRETLRRWSDSGAFRGDIRLIEKENSGAIDTLNTALHAATGELCVQLDSDASVETAGWIERMLAFMEVDERVGVVTAKVVMDTGKLHACGVNVVGPAGMHDRSSTPTESAGQRQWHHRVERVFEGGGGVLESEVAEVDAGIGCCTMYRRTDALAVGGYDTGFSPVWLDDLDLCLMIRRLGRKAFYLPDVRVVHHITGRGARITPSERFRPSRVGRAILRRSAKALPGDRRALLERRLGIDLELHFDPTQKARMQHHYVYWREKWGWDPLNPDVAEIHARWGETEICWGDGAARRAAGEEIIRAFQQGRATAV